MMEHMVEAHPDKEPQFKMEPLMFPKSPLWRQANEANEIDKHKHLNVINRRGEWGQNLPPKLCVEGQENGPQNRKGRESKDVQDFPHNMAHNMKGQKLLQN